MSTNFSIKGNDITGCNNTTHSNFNSLPDINLSESTLLLDLDFKAFNNHYKDFNNFYKKNFFQILIFLIAD